MPSRTSEQTKSPQEVQVEAAKLRVGTLLERIARRQHYPCVARAACTRRCTELELLQFADRIAQLANEQLQLEPPSSASASASALSSPTRAAAAGGALPAPTTITTDDFVLQVRVLNGVYSKYSTVIADTVHF